MSLISGFICSKYEIIVSQILSFIEDVTILIFGWLILFEFSFKILLWKCLSLCFRKFFVLSDKFGMNFASFFIQTIIEVIHFFFKILLYRSYFIQSENSLYFFFQESIFVFLFRGSITKPFYFAITFSRYEKDITPSFMSKKLATDLMIDSLFSTKSSYLRTSILFFIYPFARYCIPYRVTPCINKCINLGSFSTIFYITNFI